MTNATDLLLIGGTLLLAVANATAPAATLDVLREAGANGPLTLIELRHAGETGKGYEEPVDDD
ncbi:hypothetical protein [uncultured Marinobacter sp.]|uniref:hypothetical protein n=1 Tax=uncultured Marinobacter sp. TaxID=187379 RepID=UPI00262C77AE|nr:hypothetical protein [uncultured Marinobacter sp.]